MRISITRAARRAASLTLFVSLASVVSPIVTPLAAQMAAAGAAQEVQRTQLHDFKMVTVVEGLVSPWGFAFVSAGDILVTQRGGQLRLIRGGKLMPEPVAGVPAVRASGQGGLLDIVTHPKFAENKLVYISYSKPNADGSQGTTAVIRARWENDRLNDVQEIFEAKAWSTGRGHYGSRLAFDRDGYLFITLGDRQAPATGELEKHPSQDLTTHHGKTIRLKDDGAVPADNPFVNTPGALPEIWSYGHRNMQGIAIHPVTNEVWTIEHGPQGGDELNLDVAGKNYGWPVVGFGVNYRSGTAIHPGTTHEGMEPPVNVWVPSIAVQNLVIYTGDKFPEWKGSFFIGGLVGERLVRLTIDGKTVKNVENMVQGRGRIRGLHQGPDGFLYLAFEDAAGGPSKLVRLEPVRRS